MFDLGKIVEIRERKLADHQTKERAAVARHEAAKGGLQEARARMSEYAKEVADTETRMLRDLMGKQITLDDIRKIEETLRGIERKAQALADAHEQAKSAVFAAEAAATRARTERMMVQAKYAKIREIDGVVRIERAEAARQVEDAAMDAFVDSMAAGRGRG